MQSSNKKIPLNCHQLVFLTWFALPMIVWQSTMESFFFLSRQLRRLRLRRRRRCTFRENLHCVKAAWILSISELYLAAVQCTHCTQEFHTLLIYVILYWDRYLKNWKHIKIKEKRVFLHQNQSEWQRMDFICLIAVLYYLCHWEGGQIQSINEIPVQNYFFPNDVLPERGEMTSGFFHMFYGMR